ncbi:5-carboxymethyl-2-hydroxymuconate Delta-isomerase [bacterium]|nr:5-carboxymethyl-2-hydroxymuconate Delta-isomerase [bacterium]
MPHLTLEYSANINQSVDFKALFLRLHQVLAEVGSIDIENCKSRAFKCKNYHIARGENAHAFVHLEVCFLEGRSLSVRQLLGKSLLEIMDEIYKPSLDALNLQITVEVKDIQKALYFKRTSVKGD